ncbi:MAG: hypothetical protein ACOZQL_27050 [Myxococcota bacterium]
MAADFEDWFSATARCAKHASHAAASTCARCGAFCCDACLTQSWCEACALLVWREHLPTTARAVAWKLVLAPLFLLGSTVMWVLRGNTPSAVFFAWMVPVVCAAIVLRRFSPKAAWVGAVTSLLLLGWQALALFTDGAELRLIDVALLAIAPLLALDGAARLGRLFARVQVQESLERA